MRARRHLALGAAVALAIGLVACGDDDTDDTEEPPPATEVDDADEAPADDTDDAEPEVTDPADTEPEVTEPEDTDDAAADAGTINVATHDELGDYLVDEDGMTLYLFAQDDGTTTACVGECAEAWPPIDAAEPTAGEGVDAGLLGTADALSPNQVTYDGNLLYYFAGDAAAGDIAGVEVPDWYAVDPAGNAIMLDGGDGVDGDDDSSEGGY